MSTFIIVFFLCSSCINKDLTNNIITNNTIIEKRLNTTDQKLLHYHELGITIDSVDKETKGYLFNFSDGSKLSFSEDSVLCIDYHDLAQYEKTDKHVIVEHYEDWLFFLEDGQSISLDKALFSFDPDTVVRGVNHRGYSFGAPENTLPAYRLSKLNGFNYAETDVQFTKDGVPVIIHDPKVDRTSNGSGLVKEMLWDDLRQLDFGSWKSKSFEGTRLPSFEEFCQLCQEIRLFPYVELKTGSREQIATVVDLVEKFGLGENAVFISFYEPLLQYVIDRNPRANIGYIKSAPLTEDTIHIVKGLQTGSNRVVIHCSDYSEEAVALCKNANFPLEVWTIDSEATILALSSYITAVSSNKLHAGRIRIEKSN